MYRHFFHFLRRFIEFLDVKDLILKENLTQKKRDIAYLTDLMYIKFNEINTYSNKVTI